MQLRRSTAESLDPASRDQTPDLRFFDRSLEVAARGGASEIDQGVRSGVVTRTPALRECWSRRVRWTRMPGRWRGWPRVTVTSDGPVVAGGRISQRAAADRWLIAASWPTASTAAISRVRGRGSAPDEEHAAVKATEAAVRATRRARPGGPRPAAARSRGRNDAVTRAARPGHDPIRVTHRAPTGQPRPTPRCACPFPGRRRCTTGQPPPDPTAVVPLCTHAP